MCQPGKTHVYTWQVPERAGPGPGDPSSLVWLYHSHGNAALESGLIGAIIVTARGMAGPDGKPKDVDREFVNLFIVFDENTSWYLDHNIQTYTSDPKGVNKAGVQLRWIRTEISQRPAPGLPPPTSRALSTATFLPMDR